jgi:hypothetical protein
MKALLWILLVLALPLSAAEKLRLLMIGNSYTAQTREMVTGFLTADPEIELEFAGHTPGGSFLHQHAANPKVDELLAREWDVIVLQEQSQNPAFAMLGKGEARERFQSGGRDLLAKVRAAPGRPRILMFQTWAVHRAGDRRGTIDHFDGKPEKMQDALAKGYAWLRKQAGPGAKVVEVGRAFERWYAAKGYDDPAFRLHKADGSHPSSLGAYLTGAVFYRAITGRDPAKVAFPGGLDDGIRADLLESGMGAVGVR